jgi:ADP-heptose:LPS heptosyltransferase
MSGNKKLFLICHRGALGDFILTWPAILLLRKHFPKHKFVGLGRPDYMKLAIKLGILESFFDAESARMLDFFENGIIPMEIGHADKGVLWLKDAQNTVELLKNNSGCELTPMDPFPSEKIHVAKFHLREIVTKFKIKESINPADLTPEFCHSKRNIFCIHPGSGSQKKNYSAEFYLEIAKFAEQEFKTDVKFILGPVEIEKGAGKYFPDTRTLTPESSSELADLLFGSRLFIGNDSGASHLAGFLGVPTIALYKETDPDIWGVLGRKAVCLKNPLEGDALKNLEDFLVSRNIF